MSKPRVSVCENPQFTREVMVTRKEIAGMDLECLEKNSQGDCLCVGRLSSGKVFMVDVDYRDVVKWVIGV